MSRENRINCLETSGYFGIAAHRYASDSGDIAYLTEVLSIMYEDAAYGAMNGIIKEKEEELWELKVRSIAASELARSAMQSAMRTAGIVDSFYGPSAQSSDNQTN